jgi:hypothetical protein
MYPILAIASPGIAAKTTKAINHPLIKAKMKPDTNIAAVMMSMEIFSPIAFWKAKVSVANFDESYV